MSAGLAPITFPAYETLRPVTELSGVILCDNPSEMTFEGTNTVILRAPGSHTCVVVDPGPDDLAHAERIAAIVGEIELVVVTHRHGDHTDGIDHLRGFTSAPVRAVEERFCRDAAPWDAALRRYRWACSGGANAAVAIKIGWHGNDALPAFVLMVAR